MGDARNRFLISGRPVTASKSECENIKHFNFPVNAVKTQKLHPCRKGQDSHLVHVHHQRRAASHGENIYSWFGLAVFEA